MRSRRTGIQIIVKRAADFGIMEAWCLEGPELDRKDAGMITQVSIFTENKKGAMRALTRILADNRLNIVSMLSNDSPEFGTIRMIVDDPDKAAEEFHRAGYMCRKEQVIAVYMVDRPGCLNDILGALDQSNINIEYLYISFDRSSAAPIAVMKTAEQDIVEECLEAKGYQVLR